MITLLRRLPHHRRRGGHGQVRDLHGGEPHLHERSDEQNGYFKVNIHCALLDEYCVAGEFDHVDYKGKQTKCRSACEDQVSHCACVDNIHFVGR